MKYLKLFLITAVILFIICAGAASGLYFWASKDLPSFKKINDYDPSLVTRVLTKKGRVLG